ncbi:MAG: 50S ribosome-binding GTPase [Chloroflexi bacterium]|nr:50S ribosome-binding GTPase [Chloroflexota bacterium]
MPTNVPPQYRQAEERFRQAKTVREKIATLQDMLSIMPKHKGTDHLKAQLRARMARLMSELEGPSRGPGGGRTDPFSLLKEGGGRATLVGPTNVGKSLLLAKATGAQTRVGAYALSTQEPVQGMLPYKDIYIQLVDTPPISSPRTQSRLYGLLRNSDVFVVVVDLTLDAVPQVRAVFSELEQWGFRLLAREEEGDEEGPGLAKPTILVGNKADVPDSLDQFQELDGAFGRKYPVVMASAEEQVGLDELGEEIFRALKVIRVYTKSPREKLEEFVRTNPLVLPLGSTVAEAAEQVHKDFGRGLKYALLWGRSGKFESQRVGRRHQLSDEDIIEMHV